MFNVNVVIAVPLSLVLGIVVALVYRKVMPTANYSVSILHSLIYLSMIVSLVMIIIANEIARAFTLLGALAVIRFRTPIKDARDTAFIFFGLAAGMGSGVGLYLETALGTLLIGLLILLIHYSKFGLHAQGETLVKFTIPLNGDERNVVYHKEVFENFLRTYKLISTRTLPESKRLELTFLIQPLKSTNLIQFSQTLSSVPHIERVSIITYEEEDLSYNVM